MGGIKLIFVLFLIVHPTIVPIGPSQPQPQPVEPQPQFVLSREILKIIFESYLILLNIILPFILF